MKRLLSIFLILVLSLTSCSINIKYELAKAPKAALQQPIEVLIDKDFSNREMIQIQKAFNAWSDASQGKIGFKPVWYSSKPGVFREESRKQTGKIFMWSLSKNQTHFTIKQLLNLWELGGFVMRYKDNSTAHVVIFEDLPDEFFYTVVLHEIGHLLGLQHITNRKASMHPDAPIPCISQWDAHQLCSIYGCRPKPQCNTRTRRRRL